MILLYCFQILLFALKVTCAGILVWVFAVPAPEPFKSFDFKEKLFVMFPSTTGKELVEVKKDLSLARFRLKWNIFFIFVFMLIAVSLGQSIYSQSDSFRENIRQEMAEEKTNK